MSLLRRGLGVVVILGGLVSPVAANPIRMTVEKFPGVDYLGDHGWSGNESYYILPDDILTKGGSFSVRGDRVFRPSDSYGPPPSQFVPWETTIAGNTSLSIRFDREESGPVSELAPRLIVDVSWKGKLSDYDRDSNMGGGWESTSIWVRESYYSPWTAASGIPRELIDLVLDPRNLFVWGEVTGGRYNYLDTHFLIRPTAVPEPAPWVVAVMSACGFGVRRIWRRAAHPSGLSSSSRSRFASGSGRRDSHDSSTRPTSRKSSR